LLAGSFIDFGDKPGTLSPRKALPELVNAASLYWSLSPRGTLNMRNASMRNLRWFAVVLAVGFTGCGESTEIPGLVPVTGAVTLDGQPLEGAQVVFIPSGTDGRAASAATDAAGEYSLITSGASGAMPGKYLVIVNYYVGKDGKPIASFEEGMDITQLVASGQAKQGLPERYSDDQLTELSYEVKASGDNKYDITMKK
jgi:hypothetical protein